MLGEKLGERWIRKVLRRNCLGTEEILGWDSGEGQITRHGKLTKVKLLVVATPLHVVLADKRDGRGLVMGWDQILSADTRQEKWKTTFVLYLRDGSSVTLRTASPQPVQTLISDWVHARRHDGALGGEQEHGYISGDAARAALAADIKRKWAAGELDISPSYAIEDMRVDPSSLPGGLVRSWANCPRCGGHLVLFEDIGDCSSCRYIWCDPQVMPVLSETTGQLVGRERRIPFLPSDFETGSWQRPAAYMRGPRRDGLAPPLPNDREASPGG